MKRTIKINLSGIIFNIDDDAYEKLKAYLDTIGRHFSDQQESKEIIDDIEARIAELFQERINSETQVITLEIVEEVISIMGNPEDIADSEEPEGRTYTGTRYGRRLYRDPEGAAIGGVCSGLGAYFNIDPVIIRLLFVVFFFAGGASILVYIILWIVLPKAETAAQKLEMRGERVNVSNIEKKVREEYDNVRDNVKKGYKKARESDSYKKAERAGSDFFDVVGKILLVIVKVFFIIIGASLALAGLGILLGLITLPFLGMFTLPFGWHHLSLGDFLEPFTNPASVTIATIAVSLLLLIPIVAVVWLIARLIFNVRTRSKALGLGLIALWVISLGTVITVAALEGNQFTDYGRKNLDHSLNVPSDTLYLKINTEQEDYLEDELSVELWNDLLLVEDGDVLYSPITIDIERNRSEDFALRIQKSSKGRTTEKARENAAKINYGFRTDGNRLILDPYFSIDSGNKWRFPEVEVKLRMPEGKVVAIDHDTRSYLDGIRNLDHHSDWNMAGKTWVMTEEGLELAQKE